MARSLVTNWKRVALSGKTADGRTISADDLRAMAEAYDRDTYTAPIWIDHDRWWGSAGTVYALKAENEDSGKVGLYAQLRPNDWGLEINKNGHKLFSSIEITPDFADTGNPYLTGLAMTDEPASLGTQELYFSRRGAPGCKNTLSSPIEMRNQNTDDSALNLFKRLGAVLGFGRKTLTHFAEVDNVDEQQVAALVALRDQFSTVLVGLTELIESLDVEPAPLDEETQDAIEQTQDAVDTVVEQSQADEEFKKSVVAAASKAAADAVRAELKAARNQPAGRTFKSRTTGPVDEPKKARRL